ncbi:PilZ domain-containing protein [Zavarzinella formosa]|uniref:PilZ domain-containing protein n=1 Tax=Zavarzinella formosa TaxID=360055 RepID=UPI0002E3BED7|nr:PilZ domain-containing protein [Zavarzinella formosa]
MQTLAQLLSNLSISDPMIWIAMATGLVVILLFLFFGRRQSRAGGHIVPPSPELLANLPPPAIARHDERRRAIRRAGLPTPIIVIDPKARRPKPMEAYVLDRSTGGLRLALESPQPVGIQLKGRPSNAPENFEWVNMIVRNCKETGDYFEVGCQFESELELSRLLMFG